MPTNQIGNFCFKTNKSIFKLKWILFSLLFLQMCFHQTTMFKLRKSSVTFKETSSKSSSESPEPQNKNFSFKAEQTIESPSNESEQVEESNNFTFQLGSGNNMLSASEVREESQNSLINCKNIKNKKEFSECVVNYLSIEFYFTAFMHYKKKFKKKYNTVLEEMKRFQIFMENYQKILK